MRALELQTMPELALSNHAEPVLRHEYADEVT